MIPAGSGAPDASSDPRQGDLIELLEAMEIDQQPFHHARQCAAVHGGIGGQRARADRAEPTQAARALRR